MTDNSGIFIGGDNSGPIGMNTGGGSVSQSIIQGAQDSRAAALKQIDDLIDKLMTASFAKLPVEQVGVVAQEAKTLKNAAHEASPDPGRIHRTLDVLKNAVGTTAPLVELVKSIADLVQILVH